MGNFKQEVREAVFLFPFTKSSIYFKFQIGSQVINKQVIASSKVLLLFGSVISNKLIA